MITKLVIRNFKSIKDLSLSCRRINVFIGEPNVGKSNLLEAIGLLSLPNFRDASLFVKMLRFENFANLFCDEDVAASISVSAEEEKGPVHSFGLSSNGSGSYFGECAIRQTGLASLPQNMQTSSLRFTAGERGISGWQATTGNCPFRFYKFEIQKVFESQERGHLLPPSGANLLTLLKDQKDLYKFADGLFRSRGFRLVLRPHENKIEIQNSKDARLILFPYSSAADTIQRFIFHMAAIKTNKNATLIFEEPESHSFPFYTKQLAEEMALDNGSNQYFISTHNPYFLLPLIFKAPQDELAIFFTTLRDYETKVELLSKFKVQELADLDEDVFFNFARFQA